jgi:hypothetical protein
MVPLRLDVDVLACTWNGTVPLPVPLVTHNDTHGRLVVAVQPQVVAAETEPE